MCHSRPWARRQHLEQAFTLAELLIVILIISILITVLLPSLSAARRSAATVKCLSSLKQLHSAFQQYAQENRRFFPVVRWYPSSGSIIAETTGLGANATDRTWMDLISPYLRKGTTGGDYTIYQKMQNSSVLWGCPAFNPLLSDPTGATIRKYSLGYGMSLYPAGPYRDLLHTGPEYTPVSQGGPATAVWAYAWVTPGQSPAAAPVGPYPNNGNGTWYKMEVWGRRSQDRALLADSNGFDLIMSQSWPKSSETTTPPTVLTQPLSMGMDYPHPSTLNPPYIAVDAMRHVAASSNKGKILKQRGVNMLFVDGHAASVTPREAWIAGYGGGRDMTQ
jgi:prepilin-type N-terminal cleavage/methylation domain-containing protein/prepilin-type processing-associated H-X9-DG protein